MGWGSGSYMAERVWKIVRKHIPAEKRMSVAQDLIAVFEGEDCDTIEEADVLCDDAGRYREDGEVKYREPDLLGSLLVFKDGVSGSWPDKG